MAIQRAARQRDKAAGRRRRRRSGVLPPLLRTQRKQQRVQEPCVAMDSDAAAVAAWQQQPSPCNKQRQQQLRDTNSCQSSSSIGSSQRQRQQCASPRRAKTKAAAPPRSAAASAAWLLALLLCGPIAAVASAAAAEQPLITIEEQMEQAAALGTVLTQEQLARANPLLGAHGRVQAPKRERPSDWPDGYLAICAIIKNQHGADLREWVEYHKFIGARKIYIYDNNSTEPLASHIGDYLHSGLVEYAYFVGRARVRDLFRTTSQWWAYNDCATRFATRHRWLAFIDGDEFLVLKGGAAGGGPGGGGDIEQFLTQYEQYGGLAVNWVIFGSSGHKVRPHGGVLVNYRMCLPSEQVENSHVKVIANTAHLLTVGDDPHTVFYRTPNKWTVNELGERVNSSHTRAPSHTKIALYHYLTKSEAEFAAKIKRGSAAGNYKNFGFFRAIEELANATCTDAVPLGLRCCPSVRQDMALAAERAQAAAAGVLPGGPGSGALPPGAPGTTDEVGAAAAAAAAAGAGGALPLATAAAAGAGAGTAAAAARQDDGGLPPPVHHRPYHGGGDTLL